jgi:hypothetical protein
MAGRLDELASQYWYNKRVLSLPVFSSKYFWDVNPFALDVQQHKTFIIERLLEYGDLDSLVWVNETYPKKDIQDVVMHSKRMSPKTANFFSLYYAIPKGNVVCMTPRFI